MWRFPLTERKRNAAGATAAAVVVVVVAMFAYDRSHADRVTPGVTVGGVAIGGLDRRLAELRLVRELRTPLERPIVARLGETEYELSAARAEVEVDITGMVEAAIRRGRGGIFLTRVFRDLTGGTVDAPAPVALSYSQPAVRRFVRGIAREHDRRARDAKVNFTAAGVGEVDGVVGVLVRRRRLLTQLDTALTTVGADRVIPVPVRRVMPKVRRAQLARRYPVALTVDRAHFRLRLFRNLKLDRSYRIAVGRAGLETPAGLYSITNKAIDPAWHVPRSSWAGKLAGKVIPGGAPNNPIKARWLGVYDGVGVHGTDATASIGTRASHGCIRMLIPEVIELYEEVPVGTPIFIG